MSPARLLVLALVVVLPLTAPSGATLVLPLLGPLAAATPPAAVSIALQPPFVPPRV
jgi:hypothetical protein